jgi:hypothetical protein
MTDFGHSLIFAEACRSQAAVALYPDWRKKLLSLAELSDREAILVKHSRESIEESRKLIARVEILLSRHR